MNVELTSDELTDIHEALLGFYINPLYNKEQRSKTKADKEHFRESRMEFHGLVQKISKASSIAYREESRLT